MTTFVNKSLRFINYRKHTPAILGGLWSAALVTSAVLIYLGTNSYHRAKTRLEDRAQNYAHLIASHDRYGFALADGLALSVIDQLRVSDFTEPMTPERHEEVVNILRRHRTRLPGIASFTIIGPDGIRRAGVVGKDGTDLNHRGYFQAVKSGKDTFISNAEEGLASGKPGIHVARRVAGKDNSFAGCVVINLAVQDVFYPFYLSLNLGPNTRTTIQDKQRALLVFPANNDPAVSQSTAPIVANLADSGAQHYVATLIDPVDRIERVTAFERMEGSNIFVTVALPVSNELDDASLAFWTAVAGSFAALLTGIGATVIIARTRLVVDAHDQAMKADAEKRKFIQNVNAAIEEERRSIAVEIHDDLNATVIGARLELQSIVSLTDELPPGETVEKIRERARSVFSMTKDLYDRGRGIITRLRPEVLDALGLQGALEEMVRQYDKLHPGCRFHFQCVGELARLEGLDEPLTIAAYRIVQEALSNVVKHAQATDAKVAVSAPKGQRRLHLSIRDNGRGFDPSQATRGIGTVGMAERVFAFGGRIEVRTAPGKGTEVEVELPLRVGGTPV